MITRQILALAALALFLSINPRGPARAQTPATVSATSDSSRPWMMNADSQLGLRSPSYHPPVALWSAETRRRAFSHSFGRIATQQLLGTAAARLSVATLAPMAIGLAVYEPVSGSTKAAALLSAAIVPVVATSASVYLIGRLFDGPMHGGFWPTMVGTTGMSILALGIVVQNDHPAVVAGALALPATGGILGYEASRHSRQKGLLSFGRTGLKPGIPEVRTVKVTDPNGKREMGYHLTVVSLSF